MATKISFDFKWPDGTPLAATEFEIRHPKAGFLEAVDGIVVPETISATTDSDGLVTVELEPSSRPYYVSIQSLDSTSDCDCPAVKYKFYVPVSDDVQRVQDLIMDPPPSTTAYDEAAILQIIQYKTDAATSASQAATSATAAAQSADDAAASLAAMTDAAERSEAAAAAALVSETNAKTSETAAASSATEAATQVGLATDQVALATQKVADAAAQVVLAQNQVALATTQANNAATSATQADASKTAAAQSAADASTYATNSLNSASTAATQAGNAATSASQASTSATNAANSATAADASKTAAATSATNAQTSATNSANSATASANSAAQAAAALSTKQDKADNLTALSGLTGVANRVPMFTGAGAMSLIGLAVASGIATLGTDGKVLAAQLPDTAGIAEGTNKYFTEARVLATVLAGFVAGTNTAITAADSVLTAMNKIQAQITARAAKGANSDITSITGLTTMLAVNQGGTGHNGTPTAQASTVSWDTLTSAGEFYIPTASGVNAPGSNSYFLRVWLSSDGYIKQEARTATSSHIWSRTYTTSTTSWSAWVRTAQASEVPGKNLIINGNFDVWQRGTSQTTSAYGADDRWQNLNNGSTKTASQQAFTVGQTDVPSGPVYFSRTVVTSVTAAGNYVFKRQAIEDVRVTAGKTLTLSFYAKADAAKSIGVQFIQNFGTSGSTAVSAVARAVAITASWAKYAVTFTLPSISGMTVGTGSFLQLNFWFDAGTSFTAQAVIGQQSGTFDIAAVKLEYGSIATDWEPRTYAEELKLCQRYFVKFGTTTANGTALCKGVVTPTLTIAARAGMPWPTTMRAVPTVTFSGCQAFDGTNLATVSAIGSYCTVDVLDGDFVLASSMTGGSGRPAMIFLTNTSSYLQADAEL